MSGRKFDIIGKENYHEVEEIIRRAYNFDANNEVFKIMNGAAMVNHPDGTLYIQSNTKEEILDTANDISEKTKLKLIPI